MASRTLASLSRGLWIGLEPGWTSFFIYMDDILVASVDEQSHLSQLRQLLERLREFGLVLNLEKCQFGREEVDFLGHRISAQGVEPLSSHLSAIQEFGRPADIKALQSFLGLVNFYRRFIPGAARILLPLTNALRGGKRAKLLWTADMDTAFQQAKAAVCQATRLCHPDPQASVSLAVDASESHVGAVLQQAEGTHWRPLAFFSKKLEAAQSKYSAFDRELLAAYLAVRH